MRVVGASYVGGVQSDGQDEGGTWGAFGGMGLPEDFHLTQ